MATFVQIIEELKESMFDLQVEQDETTQAIKSLDGRMAEFVALAGRDRLEDLEDRRESKRASQKQEKQNNEDRKNAKKGIGGLSIGDLAQAYVQGRLGMALLSGLGALLVSPIGIGILTGVIGALGLKYLLDNRPKDLPEPPTANEQSLMDALNDQAESIPYSPIAGSTPKVAEQAAIQLVEETGSTERAMQLLSAEQRKGNITAESMEAAQTVVLSTQLFGETETLETPDGKEFPVSASFAEFLKQKNSDVEQKDRIGEPLDLTKNILDETKADITSRLIRTQEKKVMKAVEDDQGQIDVMATAAQYLTPDPAKAVSAEEFMKQPAGINPQPNFYSDAIVRMIDRNYIPPAAGSLQYEEFMKQNSMFQVPPIGQDIIGPIVETAIKSLRTDDNLGLGFFGAPSAGLDINELRDMNLDVEKLSIEIPPNLGGQVLSILGEGLNVGGTTVINNQTTNNVSGGGGGGGAAAVNTSSSSVAPSNDYHGTLDATQVIGGAPNR